MIEFLPALHLKAFSEAVTQQGKPELQAETTTLHDSTVTNAHFPAMLSLHSVNFSCFECRKLWANVTWFYPHKGYGSVCTFLYNKGTLKSWGAAVLIIYSLHVWSVRHCLCFRLFDALFCPGVYCVGNGECARLNLAANYISCIISSFIMPC